MVAWTGHLMTSLVTAPKFPVPHNKWETGEREPGAELAGLVEAAGRLGNLYEQNHILLY